MPQQWDLNIELYLEVHEEDSTAVLVVEGGDGLARAGAGRTGTGRRALLLLHVAAAPAEGGEVEPEILRPLKLYTQGQTPAPGEVG